MTKHYSDLEGDIKDIEPERELIQFYGTGVPEGFVPVPWPESQEYMEEDWFFEEALLINGGPLYDSLGDSAYLIPRERVEGE